MQRTTSLITTYLRPGTLSLLGVLLFALLAACSDAPTPPPTPVASVQVSPEGVLLPIGSSETLSATLRAADGQPLSGRKIAWSSNKEDVATVDGNGRVSAHGAGEATITATSEGRSGSAQITVRALSPVPQITALSPSSTPANQSNFTLTITGTGFTPDARVRLNNTPRPITYVSATELQVPLTSVDIGIPGSFEVTVVNLPPGGGVSNVLTFTVTAPPLPVASVEVNPGSTVTLWQGDVRQFSATPRAADGTPLSDRTITWSSTDPLVAGVDASGKVTAHREGMTLILATSEGRSGSATVRVTGGQLYTLRSAAGSQLPAELYTSTVTDENGVTRTLRTVATAGTIGIESGRYEQLLEIRVYLDGTLSETRYIRDNGTVQYDWPSGQPIFVSAVYENLEFRGILNYSEGRLEITQVVANEGPAVTFVYRR